MLTFKHQNTIVKKLNDYVKLNIHSNKEELKIYIGLQHLKILYIDYWAWSLLLWSEAWDYNNTSNIDGWKWNRFSLRYEFFRSFSIHF